MLVFFAITSPLIVFVSFNLLSSVSLVRFHNEGTEMQIVDYCKYCRAKIEKLKQVYICICIVYIANKRSN